MGQKHNNKQKEENNNIYDNNFEEQKLFQSFQEKKFTVEIAAISYFKFNPEDIVINQTKESISINNPERSLDITGEVLKDNKKKKIKKEIYLEPTQIKNKLFIFLETIENLVYVVDSHSFEKLFKFREESKSDTRKCRLMFQSEHSKSTLFCLHENKLNISIIKIVNTLIKSSIYCEQIQSIIFGNSYVTLYDIKELNGGEIIMGLEGCILAWDKTNKSEEIKMSNMEQIRLYDRIMNQSNFPKERDDYIIQNKGNHYYLPYQAFYLNDYNNNKIKLIKKHSVINILQLNNFLFSILIDLYENTSVIIFYDINNKKININKNNDIIINDFTFKYNNTNISKMFYITCKYFGLITIDNIYIISSQFKEIVSIYYINDIKLLNNAKIKEKFLIPSCFLYFHDHHFLIQFVDIKTQKIYLKLFKFMINHKDNFEEIFNVSKKHIKIDFYINNFLSFKNVKDIKEKDINFFAKFFITIDKSNIIKKWIITEYEKD